MSIKEIKPNKFYKSNEMKAMTRFMMNCLDSRMIEIMSE